MLNTSLGLFGFKELEKNIKSQVLWLFYKHILVRVHVDHFLRIEVVETFFFTKRKRFWDPRFHKISQKKKLDRQRNQVGGLDQATLWIFMLHNHACQI